MYVLRCKVAGEIMQWSQRPFNDARAFYNQRQYLLMINPKQRIWVHIFIII